MLDRSVTQSRPHPTQHSECETGTTPSWAVERKILSHLIRRLGDSPIEVVLWDGSVIKPPADRQPRFRITIHDRQTLWRALWNPDYAIPNAFVEGRITTEDDLVELLKAYFIAWRHRPRMRFKRFGEPSRSLSAARENVYRHYDLGNDFYRLWLDQRMLYTCAYYNSEEMGLENAQLAKMDHICHKLQLQPGEHVIEAGCGWGGLAIHMAKKYNVNVTAFNVSREQIKYANQLACQKGLLHRIKFVEDDWRNIKGRCDAFVSVGMLEHVGPENYQTLGKVIDQCLVNEGRGLIHSIGMNYPRQLDEWTQRKIFPGAQPPSLKQMTSIFEPYDFSIHDVENLRPHYALTLRHWLQRFDQADDEVRMTFDDAFVRLWRFYLSASIAAFETGWLQLYQVLFSRVNYPNQPLTRDHLYDGGIVDHQLSAYQQLPNV